jgi:hypothetical protein
MRWRRGDRGAWRTACVQPLDLADGAVDRPPRRAVQAALGRSMSGSTKRRRRHPDRSTRLVVHGQKLDLLLGRRFARAPSCVMGRSARFIRGAAGRRHHQNELGSRVSGDAGTNPADVSLRERRHRVVQPRLARSVAPRVRVNVLAPGWIETAFGEGSTARYTGPCRLDAAAPLGHARRRGRSRRVSRLAGGRVHHRADDHGRRRRRMVAVRADCGRTGGRSNGHERNHLRPGADCREAEGAAGLVLRRRHGSAASTRPTAGRPR